MLTAVTVQPTTDAEEFFTGQPPARTARH